MVYSVTMSTRQREVVPFVRQLASHGSRPALISASSTLTYSELADRVADAARRLGPDRRTVVLTGRNDVSTISTYLGALAGGHVVILAANESHLTNLVDAYRPDVTVSWADGNCQIDEHEPGGGIEPHPDLALVLSTSGSTGSPRSVRLSHDNLKSNAEAIATYLGLTAQDRAITALPMHYCYGISVIHSHLVRGAGLVLSDNSVLDHCFWRLVREHQVTSFAGVPYTFDLLDRVGFDEMDLPALRYVTQAGGRLAPDTVRRYAALGARSGWEFFVMYGQTEATARMAYLPPERALTHPSTIGVPIPGGSFTLLDSDGSTDTDEGELVYRGPNVMMGYAEVSEDLALGRTVDELRTGDLARRTGDGMYEIISRTSRFSKLFGLRIDLDRIEQQLAGSGVQALCAEGDDGLVLVVREQDPEQIRRTVSDQTSLPLRSVQVVRVDELPRLANGKPDHQAVLALARQAEPSRTTAGSPIRSVLQRALGVSEIRDDDSFVSLGGDSLSYVEASVGLEEALGRLPADWHVTPVAELERITPGRPFLRLIEMNVALRAAAILLVVGSHAGLFRFRGGAHVLLAVAGYNFARFSLTAAAHDDGSRRSLNKIARIAVPTALWLSVLTVATEGYGWQSITLLNSYLGPATWNAAWRFWFIEALVIALLALTALFAVPGVRRFDRVHPLAVPLGLLVVTLAIRFDVLRIVATPEPLLAPHRVAWLFVLGWLACRAPSAGWRAFISCVVLAAVPGFFGEPGRDITVIVGLLLLVWVPTIAVPRPLNRVIGTLAGASLYIYLTHWQVYLPLVDRGVPALVAVAAALLVGVAAWRLLEHHLTTQRPQADPLDDSRRAAGTIS